MNTTLMTPIALPTTFTDELTPRERETSQYLLCGEPYKAIANHMSISVNSVKFNVRNIYRKLGVRSRAELVYVALIAQGRDAAIGTTRPP